jgi:N-formylglutamate amidohydrolase
MVKRLLYKPSRLQHGAILMTGSTPYFEILAPAQWHVPAVFNSPHSGQFMPPDFLAMSRLREGDLRQSEDVKVDGLFSGCLEAGVPMLRALVSRAWLDLNREPYELDPRLILENLPAYMNPGSPRVAAGFGTVPRLVGEGLEIYRGRIPLQEALGRIELAYKPYHRTLAKLLDECHRASGLSLLVDCHSMPSSPASGHRSQPDIVLGDRFGVSCAAELVRLAEGHFTAAGLTVARNKPYAGGFITETYGAPQQNRHALQIEVNRGLYLDERRLQLTSGYTSLKRVLDRFAQCLDGWISSIKRPETQRRAAE